VDSQVDGSVFRTLIENTLDAVVIAARDATITYANPAAYRMFGGDPEKQEMLGTHGADYWREQDAEVLLKTIIPQALTGNWIEVQPKRRDGSTFYAQMSGFRLKDDQGRTTGIALIVHDITARKQTETENRRLATIIETTSDMVSMADPQGKIIYINPSGLAMMGRTGQDITTLSIPDYYPPEIVPKILNEYLPVVKQQGAHSWEAELLHIDGHRIPVSQTGTLLIGPDGELEGTATIVRDIAARKQAEAALRKSERLIQNLIDNSSAVIYAKDLLGRYILLNRGFEELYQLKRSAVIGKTDYDLYSKEIADSFTAKDIQALDAGCALQWEGDAPGGEVYLSVKFPMLDENGQAYGIGGISTNITGLKQAEADREFLQAHLIAAQRDSLRELSTPIIPVLEQVIILPLIGIIDSQRAKDITRALLAGISRYRAKIVIIDITGVPMIDSGVANHLNKAFQAARLKGAQAIVTGVSDAVAETIIDLGIDWSKIQTLSDLQTGLMTALQILGLKLTHPISSQ
jgi:rsbT co-antagonist protein RsbR